ncbi:phosphodiesterase [Sneathiella sp.]|uniref:phosphodiesterase n=1 Tax=Sneathiella sp. TaxID=1964365 RepID=UPI0035619FD0
MPKEKADPMLIAQLSDCHVSVPGEEFSNLYHTADRLTAAVRHVNESVNVPDLVFLTGDLVNSGLVAEYELLREIIAEFKFPTYLLAGNHDDRDNLRQVFPDHDYLPRHGHLRYVVDGWPLKLICLDTNLPGKPQGLLGPEQLKWLDAELAAETRRRVIVFLHHPPFATGLVSMDGMGLVDAKAFAEVIGRHAHIERVLCGHLHRSIQRLMAGTLVQTCPSTSHQVQLLLGEKNELATVKEPPEYLLHYWHDTDGLVTHSDYIRDYTVAWNVKDGVQD